MNDTWRAWRPAALLFALLAGYGPAPPSDTVASLAADPERLKEVRRLCREERAKVTDELCLRAALATNRRFFGDGTVPYTPPKQPPPF